MSQPTSSPSANPDSGDPTVGHRQLDGVHPKPRTDERSMMACLLLAMIAITIPAAVYHGSLLQRWGDHADMRAYLQSLEALPSSIGDWRHDSDGRPIAQHLRDQLEIRGFSHRVYQHNQTGQRVAMLLLVGPAGPLVRHPPEICYQTRANRLLASRKLSLATRDGSANLKLLSYDSTSAIDGDFYVAYAFGCRRVWDNPDSPRLQYGGEPVIYKLHVLTDLTDESTESLDGLSDFVQRLLPALNELIPAS